MKAIIFREHGGPVRLELADMPVPAIRSTEVLVEVRACALNHLDLWTLQGLPGLKIEMPHILGNDVSGVVREVGSEVGWVQISDPVIVAPGISCGHCPQCLSSQDNLCPSYDILGHRSNGGLAQYVRIPGVNALPLPDSLRFTEAAAIPLTFLTAWHMLVTRANLQPGEDVLILAAGSGVGSAAIQIAKLVGARVITTAGTKEKLELAQRLGADEVINHYEEKVSEVVKRLTNRKGVELVVEHVGSATWDDSLRSLATNGRLVTCGATTGHEARIDLRHLFYRQLTLYGSMMGSKAELIRVLKFFNEGKVRPVVDKVFPLEKAREAVERMQASQHFGKIVVQVSNGNK